MTKRLKKSLFLCIISLIGFCSCSDEMNDINEDDSVEEIYSTTITLSPKKGKPTDITTRGIDAKNGEFTAVYQYDYIYIHTADATKHEYIKIPLDNVPNCDECKGVHLTLKYIKRKKVFYIKARSYDSNKEVEIGPLKEKTDKVYFSTEEGHKWRADTISYKGPIQPLFRESENNKEILRSRDTYTFGDLKNLLKDKKPIIYMTRHCNGFRLYLMFTKVDIDQNITENTLRPDTWNSFLTKNSIDSLMIKLYLGPYLAQEYDLLESKALTVGNDTLGGYYSTKNNNFSKFGPVTYAYSGGADETYYYKGFGYQSDPFKYLFAPVLTTERVENKVKVTCVIKACYDKEISPSSKKMYFDVEVPGMKFEPDMSRIHFIILAFDYRDLGKFNPTNNKQQSSRNSTDKPEKIVLKPFKIIYK